MFSNIALCHMKREEYRESRYYLKRCLELDPENVKAQYRRCQVWKAMGKHEKALERARECIERYPAEAKTFGELLEEIVREQTDKGGDETLMRE